MKKEELLFLPKAIQNDGEMVFEDYQNKFNAISVTLQDFNNKHFLITTQKEFDEVKEHRHKIAKTKKKLKEEIECANLIVKTYTDQCKSFIKLLDKYDSELKETKEAFQGKTKVDKIVVEIKCDSSEQAQKIIDFANGLGAEVKVK